MNKDEGNAAEFIVDSESNVVRVVTFQSGRQKRLFAAFPEVVLVDSTHATKANRYKPFNFAVHDVFGRGQYVQHALVEAEEKPNLALIVAAFNKNNPDWMKIRVVMTDKALHEKEVLHEAWPHARQLLCRVEDIELTALALQLSDYAFKMVEDQHRLAVGPAANYDVDVDGTKTTLTIPATGEKHKLDARLGICDCIFRQACLLPCRHVMYARSNANYETVIPPSRTFSSRWIVHSPANNIDEGAVSPGGLNRVNCPPIKALPPIDRDTKYSRCKQLTEKVNDVISIQPSTTYRLAMKWLEAFHAAVHTGKLDEFTGQTIEPFCGFPSLSQISVDDTVTLSQLSFAKPTQKDLTEEKAPPQRHAPNLHQRRTERRLRALVMVK
ncbi:hypothetical protein PHMEG_00013092 [Phytophthora megakarya]|uniref:ZSWIM1/3 RNaseH-like domain-containing protein n=1 Tax=Phytophthora megakarya TaxID=4795 RepID=A0A225W732_9STRA|nr:hypothetical protein PHMEG_00013092 [Phytophthora megakarya]